LSRCSRIGTGKEVSDERTSERAERGTTEGQASGRNAAATVWIVHLTDQES
jgi:hypothetical protein